MFDAGETAERISQYRCEIVDALLKGIWQLNIDDPKLSLVAVGGYGRGELQPASDIDLLIVADKPRQIRQSDAAIRSFITLLWDLGLEVGQSVRTLKQCVSEARKDITVMTTLIEVRDLCGKPRVADLKRVLSPRKLWSSKQFFKAKIVEQQQRHQNFGESSYMLEPNIKESPGGLRDLQTIAWIAKRHYGRDSLEAFTHIHFLDQKDLTILRESRALLWWIRTGLHLLSGRKDDQLLFHHQRELARLAGYEDNDNALAVELFMKDYYRAVMELRRLNEMFMQQLREEILMRRRSNRVRKLNPRFQLRRQQLEVVDDQVFARHPEALMELFVLLAKHGTHIEDVNAATIHLVRQYCDQVAEAFRSSGRTNELFLEFLRQPHGVFEQLRRMHRFGVLGIFFPEFQRVTGQMQHDLFHVYTVDEHTLLCVRNALRLASDDCADNPSDCQQIYRQLAKPELLLIAALNHDIGKGLGGNHSALGAERAREFCDQLNLTADETELVAWLVNTHLDMSSLSQNSDISDANVIQRFADHVATQERLNYLYLLTIADMQATGPSVWNAWKGSLLEQLFRATRQRLRAGHSAIANETSLSNLQQATLALLPAEKIPADRAKSFWAKLDDDYFQRFSPAEMAWHARYVVPKLDNQQALVVATRDFPNRGGTGIFVYTADRPSLFANIATEIGRQALDIVDARILTTADGFALDTFIVLDAQGEPISEPEQRRVIRRAIKKSLSKPQAEQRPFTRRQDRQSRAFQLPAEISFEPGPSDDTRQMEITASNQPGLVATIASILAAHQISILHARINTYGERVQDQFIVTLPAINDAATEALLDKLQTELLTALNPDSDLPDTPVTREHLSG